MAKRRTRPRRRQQEDKADNGKSTAADAEEADSSGTESDEIDLGNQNFVDDSDGDSDNEANGEELDLGNSAAASGGGGGAAAAAGGAAAGEMEVDFGLFEPKESDFHAVRRLVQHYLPDTPPDFVPGEMADAISTQLNIGTTVRVGEDPDPYGVITVLGMRERKGTKFIKAIKASILRNAPDQATRARAEQLLDTEKANVGLLVSERIMNVPPQLAPPLYEALLADMAWALEDAKGDKERRELLTFDRFVVLAPCFRPKEDPADIAYIHFEEELLDAAATLAFNLKNRKPKVASKEASAAAKEAAADAGSDPEGTGEVRFRRAIIFDADILQLAATQSKVMLAAAAEQGVEEEEEQEAEESGKRRRRG